MQKFWEGGVHEKDGSQAGGLGTESQSLEILQFFTKSTQFSDHFCSNVCLEVLTA